MSGPLSMRDRLRSFVGVVALLLVVLALPSLAMARTDATNLDIAGTHFVIDAPDGMRGFRDAAATVVDEGWERVALQAGTPAGETIYVSIEHDMADWFSREGVPAQPPEWAAGLAITSYRTILLVPGVEDWEDTLVHEMTHIALGIATGGQPVPRWVNEGYAMNVAEQWGLERATTMIRAGILGNYYEFEDLTNSFPPAASSVELAYAQSFHIVRFLLERHGPSTLRDVFALMREGQTWDAAYVEVTGENTAATIVLWEDEVKGRYIMSPVVGGTGVGWGIAAVLVVFGWRRKTRKRREALARMEAGEEGVFAPDRDDSTFG